MKVLHLAPLWFPVAPATGGGRETLLAGLIRFQQEQGHAVTLVAAGDSYTSARLVAATPAGMVEMIAHGTAHDYAYYEAHSLAIVLERAEQFDVIHSHIGVAGLPLSAQPGFQNRVLHTFHTPLYEDLEWFVRQHPGYWYSTVSQRQAAAFQRAGATHCVVVPNGLDPAQFTYQPVAGDSLVFLGRIEALKGAEVAVQTARALGWPLTLAGPLTDRAFFDREIQPWLSDTIRYAGTVNQAERDALLGGAGCAVLPFRSNEAFGLVSIEAMACGTPVVGLASGALPEIVEPDLTGFLTTDPAELPALARRARALDRGGIRARVEERFSLARVAERYQAVYRQMLAAT